METLIYKQTFEDGCCEKCGEAINNAEYTICPKCRTEEMEYWKDVREEMTQQGRNDLP